MPLYEYRCEQCGYSYEKIQKFDAELEATCPKCGGALFRPLTAPALQFKGAGWYINDYAPKAGSAAKPGSEEKPAAATESKPAGDAKPSSESKPAAAESSAKPAAAPSSNTTS